MTTTRKRFGSAAAVAAAAALFLSACTASTGPGQSGAASSKEPPPITLGDYFEHNTDIEVAGLNGQRISSSIGAEGRWNYLPGDQPFNPLVAKVINRHLKKQASSQDTKYAPEAHEMDEKWLDRGCITGSTSKTGQEILADPDLSQEADGSTKLTIACDTVLASGKNFGEAFRFVRGTADEVVSDVQEIVYTNTETGDAARGRDLFVQESLAPLYDALYDLLGLQHPMSGDDLLPPDEEDLEELKKSLSNVSFDAKGNIYATVDQDQIAILAAGDPSVEPMPTTVVIPAERAPEMMTDLGQEISRSMAQGEEWDGPKPVSSGKEYVDCNLVACAAVTYDDGPSPLTPQVLDIYADREYAATTFFVVGGSIPGNEEILKRAVDEGHEVANHSYSHPPLTTLGDAGVSAEIEDTNKLIEDATGVPATNLRPPYGDYNDSVISTAGMPAILWSVDTLDWEKPGREALLQSAVYDAVPDDIILMHDIHEETVAVAEEIADGLLQRGFTLVTVNQLFAGLNQPGGAYWTMDDARTAS